MMPTTFNTDYQGEPITVLVGQTSASSEILVNDGEMERADRFTVYCPTITGAGLKLQVMATSGSTWYDLYVAGGNPGVQAGISGSQAKNFLSAGGYAYRFSGSVQSAPRSLVVVPMYTVEVQARP